MHLREVYSRSQDGDPFISPRFSTNLIKLVYHAIYIAVLCYVGYVRIVKYGFY